MKVDKFLEYSDEEIFVLNSKNKISNKELMEILILKNYDSIVNIANNFFIVGNDFEDNIQDGILTYIKSIKMYNVKEKIKFKDLAKKEICNYFEKKIKEIEIYQTYFIDSLDAINEEVIEKDFKID